MQKEHAHKESRVSYRLKVGEREVDKDGEWTYCSCPLTGLIPKRHEAGLGIGGTALT